MSWHIYISFSFVPSVCSQQHSWSHRWHSSIQLSIASEGKEYPDMGICVPFPFPSANERIFLANAKTFMSLFSLSLTHTEYMRLPCDAHSFYYHSAQTHTFTEEQNTQFAHFSRPLSTEDTTGEQRTVPSPHSHAYTPTPRTYFVAAVD